MSQPPKVNRRGALTFMYGLLTPTHTNYFCLGREGFEPPKAQPPDLQSGAVDHFATYPKKMKVLYTSDQSVQLSPREFQFPPTHINFLCAFRSHSTKHLNFQFCQKPKFLTPLQQWGCLGREGFEPTNHKGTVLRTACFNHLHTYPKIAPRRCRPYYSRRKRIYSPPRLLTRS